MTAPILILSRRDIAGVMRVADYHEAVAAGFRAFARGEVQSPPPMEIAGDGGAFHVKGASMAVGGRRLAAVKVNGNFPLNPMKNGLPTIQGAVLLSDAETGALLAILDSIEVTLRRTAAASAVATDLLARRDAATLFICGCGVQGRAHAEAIAPLRPFERGLAFDAVPDRAHVFAREMTALSGLRFSVVESPRDGAREADVIATTTTAGSPILAAGDVGRGAFIAAVGADSPKKNEIAPALMGAAAIFTDVTDQCVAMGDLRAAIAANALTREGVRGELGEVVAGLKRGRAGDDEIVIFDSTGAAFEDLAAAAMIYDRAKAVGAGADLHL